MTMWIVLGALALVVVGIIGVMSILDRKKAKIAKQERQNLEKEIDEARLKVAQGVLVIIKNNENKLKKFVPSVGKLKMSDIKNAAREELKLIERKRAYKLTKQDPEKNQKLHNHFKNLKNENSNLWASKLQNDIKYFEELFKEEKTALANAKLQNKKHKNKSPKKNK